MILVAVTNRSSYPRCKTLIDVLGDECRVLLMDPEPEIEGALAGRVIAVSWARSAGGGQSMAATGGRFQADCAVILGSSKPECLVVIADRHEVLGAAAAARIMGIPVVHLLAGERSGSVDDYIRFAISALANLCLAPHDRASAELLRHGISAESTVVTGCPSIDLCGSLGPADDVNAYGHGSPINVERPYYIVCQHPDTGASQSENVEAIKFCDELVGDMPVVWIRPTQHERYGREMDKCLSQLAGDDRAWLLIRHIPHDVMLSVLGSCTAMIGNSSIMYREAAYLGVPCYPIGHRQSGRLMTRNMMATVARIPKALERMPGDRNWVSGGGKRAAGEILVRYGRAQLL